MSASESPQEEKPQQANAEEETHDAHLEVVDFHLEGNGKELEELFSSIGKILDYASFIIFPGGIVLQALNTTQTTMLYLTLPAACFRVFSCEKKMVIDIAFRDILSKMNGISKFGTSMMRMWTTAGENKLFISFASDKGVCVKSFVNLLAFDEHPRYKIPSHDYNTVFSLGQGSWLSDFMQMLCVDADNVSNGESATVRIASTKENVVTFSTDTTTVTVHPGKGMDYKQNVCPQSERFNLRQVHDMSLPFKRRPTDIYVNKGKPLVLRYNVLSSGLADSEGVETPCGTLRICIACVMDEEGEQEVEEDTKDWDSNFPGSSAHASSGERDSVGSEKTKCATAPQTKSLEKPMQLGSQKDGATRKRKPQETAAANSPKRHGTTASSSARGLDNLDDDDVDEESLILQKQTHNRQSYVDYLEDD